MSLRARAARLPPRLRDDQTIVDFAELDSEGEEEAMDADEAGPPPLAEGEDTMEG